MDFVRTYTPEDIVVVMQYNNTENGLKYVQYLDGWNNISIKRSSPVFKLIKGIRGNSARTRSLDRSWTMTISLDQTSKANYHLNMLLSLDHAAATTSMLSFYIYDDNKSKVDTQTIKYFEGVTGYQAETQGFTCIESASCFIEGMPDVVFDRDTTERVWTVVSLNATTYRVGYSGTSLREQLLDNPSGFLSTMADSASNALSAVGKGLSNITKVFK